METMTRRHRPGVTLLMGACPSTAWAPRIEPSLSQPWWLQSSPQHFWAALDGHKFLADTQTRASPPLAIEPSPYCPRLP